MRVPVQRAARLHLSSTEFICSHCCSNARFLAQAAFHSSSRSSAPQPDFTSRLRSRIWGTDDPPGPKELSPGPPDEGPEAGKQTSTTEPQEMDRLQDSDRVEDSDSLEGLEDSENSDFWQGVRKWEERRSAARLRAEEMEEEEARRRQMLRSAPKQRSTKQHPSTSSPRGKPKLKMTQKDISEWVRKVAVQLLALRQAGVRLEDVALGSFQLQDKDIIDDIDIIQNSDGTFALREQYPGLINRLTTTPRESQKDAVKGGTKMAEQEEREAEEIEPPEQEVDASQTGTQTMASNKVHDPIYLQFPLEDAAFKYALASRLGYIVNKRIPDAKASSFQTLEDVVSYLTEKPTPKRLTTILLQMPEVQGLRNVEITDVVQTRTRKSQKSGLQRAIRAELKARDLFGNPKQVVDVQVMERPDKRIRPWGVQAHKAQLKPELGLQNELHRQQGEAHSERSMAL